ncbi:MAG TPA: protein kinase [Polyangiales bacterium]|nr:protein kinase [Polyangiales bacterium]
MLSLSNKRFQLVRLLGEGASGAVYLALDNETGEQVALKQLFKLDQKSVARFKREFRALADIHHPNLVKLYDLNRGPESWFLTMEYVAGKDFRHKFGADASGTRESMQPANDSSADAADERSTRELLRVFYDLACGVHAIHRAGMLHRDLKPSNALIADDGRVVVVDFGLVREIDGDNLLTQDGMVAGTPAYMPPEQAMGDKLSEASDWYAFGVMLYEAISGVLPIESRNVTLLLQRKLTEDPAPLEHGAPPAVLGLCMELLARDPALRPPGSKVLDVLAAAGGATRDASTAETHPLTMDPAAITSTATLFGREVELAQLHALTESPREHSVVVHVRGSSGCGKSALVEQFLEDITISATTPWVVLRGRCYEREAMPFKAMDGIIDALVAELFQLDDITCAQVLPPNIFDLARLFPVFERLRAVQMLNKLHRARGDESQIRRRAEQALRRMITTIANDRCVVLWIDDMQWGDLDSASVLRDWLETPLMAPVIVVLSYRSEEMQTSSALRLLLDGLDEKARALQTNIDIDPLPPDDVRRLCMHRLAQRSQAPESMVARIIDESRGNPFLAQQLTAIAEAKLDRHDTSLEGLSIDAMIERAGSYLDASARALLHVLAIAGRPVRPQLAIAAAGVSSSGRANIHALRGLRLIRTRDISGEQWLEVYHDRVRETVQGALSPTERTQLYQALLQQAEIRRVDEHDWLHALALGAGQRTRAFHYGLLAAQHASATLAFERAVELYKSCLELSDSEQLSREIEPYALWVMLATAQAHCRRGYEAAKAYSAAAEHAPADKRVELLQLAAAHLVRSGRFEEGEHIVQQVLTALKLHVPKSRAGLFAAIAWEHGRIALRSFDVPSRSAELRSRRLEQAAMLYGTLSIETQLYNTLRAALFQSRALRISLDYGTPSEVARALCLSATIACISGTRRAARRSEHMLQRAEELYRRSGSPELQLELLSARAVCAQFVGDIEGIFGPARAVEELIEARSTTSELGDYYYLFAVRMVHISALQSLGKLLEARKILDEHVASARATDNLAAILQVTVSRVIDEQARDMCAGTRARLDDEYNRLPQSDFSVLTAAHMLGVMRAACATGDYDWAFARLAQFWEPYRRSLVHRSAFLAMLAHTTHARLLVNHHVQTGATADIEALVSDDLAVLARLPKEVNAAVSIARTRARLAALNGERERAVAYMRPCLQRMEGTNIKQETEHDRYVLGLLVGGDEGSQLIARARTGLLECGINDPDANMRAYAPELMR